MFRFVRAHCPYASITKEVFALKCVNFFFCVDLRADPGGRLLRRSNAVDRAHHDGCGPVSLERDTTSWHRNSFAFRIEWYPRARERLGKSPIVLAVYMVRWRRSVELHHHRCATAQGFLQEHDHRYVTGAHHGARRWNVHVCGEIKDKILAGFIPLV